jgi:flagellar basal-body rod protein FlgG
MIRSLWIAKTGLDSQQTNLDVITNNLANSQTTAFKRIRPVFSELMYQTLRADGLGQGRSTSEFSGAGAYVPVPVGLSIGNGSAVVATQRINSQGQVIRTENPLDLAIKGLGYMVIATATPPAPENIAYTRAGNFMRDNQGYIVNPSGNYLLDVDNQPIRIPSTASSILIGEDGTVTYYEQSTITGTVAGQIQLVTFMNPTGLSNGGGDLYYETLASGAPVLGTAGEDGLGTMLQYYTEQSNVNIAEELVGLIAAQRAYEITTRSISASDSILQKLGNI